MTNVTASGEITWDEETGLFTVWDESYAYQVYTTPNKSLALAVFEDYCRQLDAAAGRQ